MRFTRTFLLPLGAKGVVGMLMLMLAQKLDEAPDPSGKENWEMARDAFFSVPFRFGFAVFGALVVLGVMQRGKWFMKLVAAFGAGIVLYILHGFAWAAYNEIADKPQDIPYQISLGRVFGLLLYAQSLAVLIVILGIALFVYMRQDDDDPSFARKLALFGTVAGSIAIYLFVANTILD